MFRFKLKDIVVECSKCRHRKEFNNDAFDYNFEAVDERSMGTEFQHTWKLEEKNCEKCHRPFSLSIDMWEYPLGCMNYTEKQIEGASFVSELEIENLGEPDDGEN